MCHNIVVCTFVLEVLNQLLLSIGKLKAVTKKLSSGASHITFQSSSSSESSSESESSSSSDSSESDTSVTKNRQNKVSTNNTDLGKASDTVQTPSPSVVKPTPASVSVVGTRNVNGQAANAGVAVRKRGRRTRKKTLSSNNIIVGGDRDVLTTKSTVYKSPVTNKKALNTNSKTHNNIIGSSDTKASSLENCGSSTNKVQKTATSTNTKVDGKEKAKKPASNWDVQPTVPFVGSSLAFAANSALVDVCPPPAPASEQTARRVHPPRDYSALPELQGPPRQGDRLAFKVRFLLICSCTQFSLRSLSHKIESTLAYS